MKRRTVLQALVAVPIAAALPAPRFEFNRIPLELAGPFPRVPAIPDGDLALNIKEFQFKYIRPAMQRLAWSIEQDALTWADTEFWSGDQWTKQELEAMTNGRE